MLVEVAYALPDRQSLLSIEVEPGCTVEQAILKSGILKLYPEIDLASNPVGIWNTRKKLDDVLRERDRVEIYRPLIADPKEIRKKMAAEGKVMKKGGK
jgi:uncharacterized protein